MRISPEILIIGGGPAGCAAALQAYNEGCRNITIVEKQPYDRHRIGEIFLTNTILEFQKLGIHDELLEFQQKYKWNRKFAAAYVHGKDRTPWQVVNSHPFGFNELEQRGFPRNYIDEKSNVAFTLVVRRHEFDEALREICKQRGIDIIHGFVDDCNFVGDINSNKSSIISLDIINESNEKIKARPKFIIDATGQQAFFGKKNKNRFAFGDVGLQARYTYFEDVDFTDAIEKGFYKEGANIVSFDDGWVWIADLGNNHTSVGIVSKYWDDDENYFWKKLSRLPEYLLFNLDKAKVTSYKKTDVKPDNFYVHSNYRFKTETLYGKNWACAGDAAMFLDPLLSQGVTLAVSYGSKLGKTAYHIVNDDFEPEEALAQYEQAYINEIEILNKVVSLWYKPDFSISNDWFETSKRISHIFGREIGEDVESFRWISNLENIQSLFDSHPEETFLKEIEEVNEVQMVSKSMKRK